ncbi:MAG TPA: DUF1634 domain-containing protein [Gemmatimonadales bacterium]|jgi:uncharacterized membrane protein|nr:DUF1634 domain-containing protein [Gemmatimonadales bacterium]
MATREPRWSDERVAQWVGNVLRSGVIAAAAVTLLGAIALLLQHGSELADYHVFGGAHAELRSISSVVAGALRLDNKAVVQLGIILLLATPVVRVLLSLVAFILQRDRLYMVITSLVLAILLYSLLLGGRV